MRRLLAISLLAGALPGCALLADPISDVTQAAFDVPLFGSKGKPQSIAGLTVQDLPVFVDVQPGTSAHLPDVDTSDWGAVLRFDQIARQKGYPRAFSIALNGLDVADSLDVVVKLSSRAKGRVLGERLEAGTELPAACRFGIGPATTDAQLAGLLDGCVTAYVDAYGAPVEPEMEISVETPGGGQGLHTEGSFAATWNFTMHAESATTVGCKEIEMDEEIKADAAYLTFEKLKLAGAGGSTADVDLEAFAVFYDPVAGRVASGEFRQSIAAGTRYWINAEVELPDDVASMYTQAGNVSPTLSPSGTAFVDTAVKGLVNDGFGYACWRVSGDAPRDGFVTLAISGVGKYDLGGR